MRGTMFLKQFFEEKSSTYTYLLASIQSKEAIIIDPVLSEIEHYLDIINKQGFNLLYILETHIHADHVTAASKLREKTKAKSIVHKNAHISCADILITDGCVIRFGEYKIEARYTPGHTDACTSYYIEEEGIIFTGDTLLINGCGRTDFQHGSAVQLYQSIHNKIFTLPENTIVYPAHDYRGEKSSTVKKEKQDNARLGQGKTQEEFVELMQNLNLPYPKQIDIALPLNQTCGQKKDA